MLSNYSKIHGLNSLRAASTLLRESVRRSVEAARRLELKGPFNQHPKRECIFLTSLCCCHTLFLKTKKTKGYRTPAMLVVEGPVEVG